MSKFNLIFAGLARDCGHKIASNIAAILSIAGKPEISSLQLLVAENDSKDNTREILLELSKAHECLELKLLPPLDNSFPQRVRRIAYCRQVLLEAVQEKASYYPIDKTLFVPVDLDSDIFSTVDLEIFIQSCQSLIMGGKTGAIFPASYPYYYDVLALRSRGWCQSDCMRDFGKFQRFRSKFISMIAWHSLVVFRQKSLSALVKKGDFISVDSAFGGFGIYRLEAARFAKYYACDWGSDVYASANEHVLFNRAIPFKVIQTSLVVMAPEEHVAINSQGLFTQIINYLAAIRWDALNLFSKLISGIKSLV